MAAGARRGVLDEAAYTGLACLFYLAPRLLYDIHIETSEPATFPPATLIVANHKRDLDSVVLPATLFWMQPPPRAPLAFAGREDMFVRGFLAGYDVVPRWLRRLLYEIDLTGVMRALRVLPVRRFPERTMAEALREALAVLGDGPLADLLTDEEMAAAAGTRGSAVTTAEATVGTAGMGEPARTVAEALAWRYYGAWRGPARMRAFREPFRSRLESRQRDVVEAQMAALAAVLDGGGVLYLAPEGVISPDGRLQAFRSGLQQILEATARPVQVRPVSIVYDFMRPGRLRIFIAMRPAFPARGAAETAREARAELARLHVMTASQLCSFVVWERARAGRPALQAADLVEETESLVAYLTGQTMRVDPDLRGRRLEQRVGEWITYARRHGLLTTDAGPAVTANDAPGAADAVIASAAKHSPASEGTVAPSARLILQAKALDAPVGHATNPIRYAVNELTSVCEALGVALDRGAARPASVASGP